VLRSSWAATMMLGRSMQAMGGGGAGHAVRWATQCGATVLCSRAAAVRGAQGHHHYHSSPHQTAASRISAVGRRSLSSPAKAEGGVAVIGAGLAGSLLAVFLRRRGYTVEVYEQLADPRRGIRGAGRSINLVLTSRGLDALEAAGSEVLAAVEAITVPVFGRVLHSTNGATTVQHYGPDRSHFNLSVSRSELNATLMNAAEAAGATLHFGAAVSSLELLCPGATGPRLAVDGTRVRPDHIFGVDGAASPTRKAVVAAAATGTAAAPTSDETVPLGTSYKELSMQSLPGGQPAMAADMLHIWPRGEHFLMGLANRDGSFTMTLYLPDTGPVSFEALDSDTKVEAYFKEHYADALPHMPHYLDEFQANPTGFLGTLRCAPWHAGGDAVLLGDAAHAITPFFGQGCNCAFEDVRALDRLMETAAGGPGQVPIGAMPDVFAAYDVERKPNGDAIASLALDNYSEMASRTADPRFLLAKEVELRLAREIPGYASRYTLVTHTLVPYAVCHAAGKLQAEILEQLVDGIETADEVDMELAAELIEAELGPLLRTVAAT